MLQALKPIAIAISIPMPIAMISQGNRLLLLLLLTFGIVQMPDGNFHSFHSWAEKKTTSCNLAVSQIVPCNSVATMVTVGAFLPSLTCFSF